MMIMLVYLSRWEVLKKEEQWHKLPFVIFKRVRKGEAQSELMVSPKQ